MTFTFRYSTMLPTRLAMFFCDEKAEAMPIESEPTVMESSRPYVHVNHKGCISTLALIVYLVSVLQEDSLF